jgi:hypothetical protein
MRLVFLILFTSFSFVNAAPVNKKKKERQFPKEAIIQAILDLDRLQPYLHPEISGRVPLVVSDHLIGRKLKLIKFNKKVKIVSDKNISGAYIRFTVFECKEEPAYCNIAFEYPIEGIQGSTGVSISPDGTFKFEKMDIVEN